jgi:hypothetical protein
MAYKAAWEGIEYTVVNPHYSTPFSIIFNYKIEEPYPLSL